MPIDLELSAGVALDRYVEYYTEKLWAWIPEHYRDQDARTSTPGTLRALVERLGAQAAAHRRKLDRLWENNFVELADDDVLAKLGELVATRMVHAANRRARRVDVARTIYYRRRKGTPRVLESLITDITGWSGAHLETRSCLARTAHVFEPSPDLRRGAFTRTPLGGTANLRSQRIPALAHTAFEELAHTPDFRRFDEGVRGRYGIAKIGIHLYRMRAFKLEFPTLALLDAVKDFKIWALDPSGRDVPLFQPANRPTADCWTKTREWQMPKPLSCRLLSHAQFEWTDELIENLVPAFEPDAEALLKKYSGWRISSELELRRLIASFPGDPPYDEIAERITELMDASLTPDSSKGYLYDVDDDGSQALTLAAGEDNTGLRIPRPSVVPCNLSSWNIDIDLGNYTLALIDPTRGRLFSLASLGTMLAPVLYYGFAAEIGAGTYDRSFAVETVGVTSIPNDGHHPGPIEIDMPNHWPSRRAVSAVIAR